MNNVTNVADILDLDEPDEGETFFPMYRGHPSTLRNQDFMRQFMVHDTEGYIKPRSQSQLEKRINETQFIYSVADNP